MPTRVIAVGDKSRSLRLLVTKGLEEPYLALYYCWGPSQTTLKLTKDTFDNMLKSIKEEADSLPSDITPTLARDVEWVKSEFGEDVHESVIRTVLDRAVMTDDFQAYTNDGEIAPLIRPGFGKEFWEMPDDDAAFPSAMQEWKAFTLTWGEIAILWFVEEITNKPDWYVKVFDEIVAKWEQEALAKLREKAKLFEATGLIPILDTSSAVIKSDSATTPEVKEALKQGVAALENIPENEKDWHPGSDSKVLDLVHPSLWPLVFGKSRIAANKHVIPVPKKRYPDHQSSDDLWPPCDIDIEEGKPKIMSYINNLHPKHHAGLYTTIEKVLEKGLPMWDLIDRWHGDYETLRIPSKALELQPKDVNLDSGFFNQADRIQVIVKLVNIHLTPEKPTYNSRS
ncbi:DUF4246 domain-containing protein [Colletotrichum asianum]